MNLISYIFLSGFLGRCAAAPRLRQDMSGTYYYQYNIKDIVTMFNTGLQKAWTALETTISTLRDETWKPE